MSSPSTSLVATPAPQSLYGGVSQQYMNALTGSGLAGTASQTLSQAASGSLPMQTSPQVTAMQKYLQQYQTQGAQNLKEQFGAGGLGASSSFGTAAAQYEASSAADMGNIMAQYQLAQQQQQVGAATTAMQLESAPALATYAPDARVTGPSLMSQLIGGAAATGSLLAGIGGLLGSGTPSPGAPPSGIPQPGTVGYTYPNVTPNYGAGVPSEAFGPTSSSLGYQSTIAPPQISPMASSYGPYVSAYSSPSTFDTSGYSSLLPTYTPFSMVPAGQ